MSEKYNYKNICAELLSQLPQKQSRVLEGRFGLAGNKRETLQKIGDDFGVTRERIRQIEAEAFSKLRKEQNNNELDKVFASFVKYLKEHGGLKREDIMLLDLGGDNYKNNVLFLLTLGNSFNRVSEDNDVYPFWVVEQSVSNAARELVASLVKKFNKTNKPLSKNEVLSKDVKADTLLLRAIEVAKQVEEGPLGNFGLVSWPEIKPRGVRDAAFLCLKKASKPMHFREIAVLSSKLQGEFFDKKKILPQTVHNELIRDNRFVLVGRGVYALREWGYAEGTVRDVIKQVLADSQKPMERDKIVQLVLAKRIVKPNTVLLNLNSSTHFKKEPNGKYTIIES